MQNKKTNQSRVPLNDLLDALCPVVRHTMTKYFASDCCIATSKMLIEVFAFYGYKAREVATLLYVFNAAMVELMKNGIRFPEDQQERMDFFDRTGAWSLGVVPKKNGIALKNSFHGHLVVNVDGILVDASLQQVERPKKQIELPPLLSFKPDAGFFAPRCKKQRTSGTLNGCLVTYVRLDDESYRNSLNWRQEHAGVSEAYHTILTLTSRQLAKAGIKLENSAL